MRCFIHLAYNGAPFHGWQSQPNAVSVQQTIEDALERLLHARTPIVGAGRTDTGVNARKMVAHVDLPADVDLGALQRSLAALVCPDISIYSIRRVPDDAHARFDATARTYRYFVTTCADPFTRPFVLRVRPDIDFDKMNVAAQRLLGTRDFTSFSKLHTDTRTNICTITHAQWSRVTPTIWQFEVTADRFLRNMVRAIVGTLLEVGRGQLAPEGIDNVLESMSRSAAGMSVSPTPLFLWDIRYPYYDTDSKREGDMVI